MPKKNHQENFISLILAAIIHLFLFLMIFCDSFFASKNSHQGFNFKLSASFSENFEDISKNKINEILPQKKAENLSLTKSDKSDNLQDNTDKKIVKNSQSNSGSEKSQVNENSANNSNSENFFDPDVLYYQLPEITKELRKNELNLAVIAEFILNQDGSVKKVSLLKMTSDPKMNFLLKKNLEKWRFKSSQLDSKKKVSINLRVN
jgi:hypothetical protein